MGVDRFVGDHLTGWNSHGNVYEEIPLEQMAYELQARYERGDVFDAEREVESRLGAAAKVQ